MKNFCIESLGCCINRVDSNRVARFLVANGWQEVSQVDKADMVVLMTCAFTQFHEDNTIARLLSIQKTMKDRAKLLVGGCLPGIAPKRLKEVFSGFSFGPRSLEKLDTIVNGSVAMKEISGRPVSDGIQTIRVATGCRGRCTYCAIPFAGGKTKSYPIQDIWNNIRTGLEEGVRIFALTAEDVGAYGQDIGLTIVDLLEFLLERKEDFRLMVDTLNPQWAHRYLLGRNDILGSERLYSTLYIPIQSGSDRILNMMKRGYTSQMAKEVIEFVAETAPHLSISTDFIVGFPTETEEDFNETKKILSEYEFGFLEVFQYQDRPGVPAAKLLPKVDDRVKEERAAILCGIFLEQLAARKGEGQSLIHFLEKHKGPLPLNVNINMGKERVNGKCTQKEGGCHG